VWGHHCLEDGTTHRQTRGMSGGEVVDRGTPGCWELEDQYKAVIN